MLFWYLTLNKLLQNILALALQNLIKTKTAETYQQKKVYFLYWIYKK